MIEALLQKALLDMFARDVIVESAGTHPECGGHNANEHSVTCMDKVGINLQEHRSRYIGDLNLDEFFMVVVAEPHMKDVVHGIAPSKTVLVANETEGGISNPFGKGPEAYDECVVAIRRSIPELLRSILVSA